MLAKRKKRIAAKMLARNPQVGKLVAVLSAGGMTPTQVATAFGTSLETLTQIYGKDLVAGAIGVRADMLSMLYKTAMAGNVSAQKEFISRSDMDQNFSGVRAKVAIPDEPKAEKPKPLGKKEQANADAVTAAKGTSWADLVKH